MRTPQTTAARDYAAAWADLIRRYRRPDDAETPRLTQVEFAEALGVTQQTVSRWESGKTAPPGHVTGRIAAVLGIPADELLEVMQAGAAA